MATPKLNASMFKRKPEASPAAQKRSKKRNQESRKNIVTSAKDQREKKKLHIYICTLENGREVEIRAESDLDTGKLCYDKHGEWPIKVTKKPFERTEHLMNRPFSQNEQLRELQRQFNRKGN